MDEALKPLIEMNQWIWNGFQRDLQDMPPEEADWRPLPQANSINLILRHLRIEAAWHLANIQRRAQTVEPPAGSEPLDFKCNLAELEASFAAFMAALRRMTPVELRQQSALVYQDSPSGRSSPPPAHFLAYHQAVHLAMHWGQIRTIRNLYCKTRGKPARFFPENPSFPA